MTASTRKQVREYLAATTFAASGFTAVYDYLPLDLVGASKVLCVYNDSTRHEQLSAALKNDFYRFNLDVLVKRAGGNAEDDLDTLHEAIRAAVVAGVGNTMWNEITLEEDSEALFASVAGIAYRVEQHKLLIKVTQ